MLYQSWLDRDAAKRIFDWARQGLKVVILEDAASTTPGDDGKDKQLADIVKKLKQLPTVRAAQVADDIDYFSEEPGGYDDNVMEKLQELGVYPYTGYPEQNQQLLTQTRGDDAGNEYVYVYNYDDGSYHDKSLRDPADILDHGTNIQTDIVKDGLFVPYTIDAWTGEVTETAEYRWEDGRTIVPIDLDYDNVALLAFEKVGAGRTHIVSSNGESSYATAEGIAVRATESGTLSTTLSDGVEHDDAVTVPDVYDITDWDLTVQSWRAGTEILERTETIDGLTTTNKKASTEITEIDVELDTLTTWNNIPEVGQSMSGTGHYEATFEWDASAASGAYLDFGDSLEESMEVWINGQKVGGTVSTNPTKVTRDVGGTVGDGYGNQVPLVGEDLYTGGVSFTKPVADISEYLVDGENQIVIDYSSALANVQLDRGVITEQSPLNGFRGVQWWGNDQVYLDFGPKQATNGSSCAASVQRGSTPQESEQGPDPGNASAMPPRTSGHGGVRCLS